jgi:hypothetical protein
MRKPHKIIGAAGLAALLLSPAACGEKPRPPAQEGAAVPAVEGADQAQSEATQLGRDMTNVLDRVLAYASARGGRAPESVAEVGLDSLTPKLVRRVSRQGRDIAVTVGFRNPNGRVVLSCQGTNRVLEDLTLLGHFELPCAVADGGTRTFTVEPEAAAPKCPAWSSSSPRATWSSASSPWPSSSRRHITA